MIECMCCRGSILVALLVLSSCAWDQPIGTTFYGSGFSSVEISEGVYFAWARGTGLGHDNVEKMKSSWFTYAEDICPDESDKSSVRAVFSSPNLLRLLPAKQRMDLDVANPRIPYVEGFVRCANSPYAQEDIPRLVTQFDAEK